MADGFRSVTLITPRQLLRQSEDALNQFLCNAIVNKSPLTFNFDRSTGKAPNEFSSAYYDQMGVQGDKGIEVGDVCMCQLERLGGREHRAVQK